MKKIYLIVLLLIGTLAAFGIYAEMLPAKEETPSWNGTQAGSMMETPDVPGAENVSDQYKTQVEQLKTYLADNPEDTTHLRRLARLYQDGHNPESAAVYYEQLLQLKPSDHQSWLDLTNCYATVKNWDKAKAATLSLLKNFPEDEEGRYNLGAIQANTGNTAEARKLWSQLTSSENETIADLAKQSLQKLDQPEISQNDSPQ